jgi:2',3'-cyclic-nucleotide 2'-phosphodiesterase
MMKEISVLFIGDVVGEDALVHVCQKLPEMIETKKANFVVVNGENIWQGKGLNEDHADKLFAAGAHVITTGNHVWENWKSRPLLAKNGKVLRPYNYPVGNPGRGFYIYEMEDGVKVAILQIQGRTFMADIDCPFRGADHALKTISSQTNNIIVDFHAEATAEKQSMGWHLDGQVSAIIGTHTHVPTADAQILPSGTAYVSDVGMCGSHGGVIGMRKDIALKRYTLGTAHKYELAEGDMRINVAHILIDAETGQALSIGRQTIPDFEKRLGD